MAPDRSAGTLGRHRSSAERPPGSREFVDDVLAELRAGRWSPRAWLRFVARSSERSVMEAWRRPSATLEITALHAAAFSARRGWWTPIAWSLAITHLGLLGDRTSLGWPNRLTVARGLMPAIAPTGAPWIAALALATDLADGRIARTTGPTAFGFYADALADASFWTWFVLQHEPSPTLHAAAVTAWVLPACAVTATYLAGGRSVDYPRPVVLRNASVALQVLVTARALWCRRTRSASLWLGPFPHHRGPRWSQLTFPPRSMGWQIAPKVPTG